MCCCFQNVIHAFKNYNIREYNIIFGDYNISLANIYKNILIKINNFLVLGTNRHEVFRQLILSESLIDTSFFIYLYYKPSIIQISKGLLITTNSHDSYLYIPYYFHWHHSANLIHC